LGEARLAPAEDERLTQPLSDLGLTLEEQLGTGAQRLGQRPEGGRRGPGGGGRGDAVTRGHRLGLGGVGLEPGQRGLPPSAEGVRRRDGRVHQPTAAEDVTPVPGVAAAWCQASRRGATSARQAATFGASWVTLAVTSSA